MRLLSTTIVPYLLILTHSLCNQYSQLVPYNIRLTTEEVTLRARINIRNCAHHGVIDIHNSKVGKIRRVVSRPVWLRSACKALRIRIEVYGERGIPIFHDNCQRRVIDRYITTSAVTQGYDLAKLTGRVSIVQERPSSAMQLSPGIEDELPSRLAPIACC